MYGASVSDESDEDEGCYVYWDTPSILPPATAPKPSPRRPSQRSGAPSPSLGTAAEGTPRPKRTTTAAALPSPSASTTGTKATRALRQRKRLKGARRGAAAEASSQPLDARALQMVSQLAMKVNARAAGMGSPALPRTRQATASAEAGLEGKGKAKAVQEEPTVKREPLRPLPTANVPSTSTTPLRRTPVRAARVAQPMLSMSATKANGTRGVPSIVKTAPHPVVLAPAPVTAVPPSRPPLGKSTSSTTVTDDFDSFFDDADDTFELALSQLDESVLAPTPPSSIAAAAPAAALALPAARVPSRILPARNVHPPVRSPPKVAAPDALPVRAPAAAAGAARKPPPALVVRTSRSSQRSVRQAMAELAQREADALAADLELGAGGWSDEDF